MTIGELERRMSAKEFAMWQVYSQIEPFGARTHHMMQAQATALLYNVNRDPKKGEALQANDFDLFEGKYDQDLRKTAEKKRARKRIIDSVKEYNAQFEGKA